MKRLFFRTVGLIGLAALLPLALLGEFLLWAFESLCDFLPDDDAPEQLPYASDWNNELRGES